MHASSWAGDGIGGSASRGDSGATVAVTLINCAQDVFIFKSSDSWASVADLTAWLMQLQFMHASSDNPEVLNTKARGTFIMAILRLKMGPGNHCIP